MIILIEPYIWLMPQSLIHLLLVLLHHNTLILLVEHYWSEHCQSPFWMRPSYGCLGSSQSSTCSQLQKPVTSKSSERFHRQLRDRILHDHLHLPHFGLLGPSLHFLHLPPLAVAVIELFSTVAAAEPALTIAERHIELKD